MKRFSVLCVMLCVAVNLWAAVPQQINYQGYLTRPSGSPLDTVVSITFKLYDAATGGTQLWTETQNPCSVRAGLFNVRLGQNTTLNDSVLNHTQLWLGIQVGSDGEMTPRDRVLSVGYSYRVGTVDGASGGTVSGDVNIVGKGNIGTENINSGTMAFVAGQNNFARGAYSTIGGGGGPSPNDTNSAIGDRSSIGGGRHNVAVGYASTISGGTTNTTDSLWSVIGGGVCNRALGNECTVGGGAWNTAGGGDAATVAGGWSNRAWGFNATVGGGWCDTASYNNATVAGGYQNSATANGATVSGGWYNAASGGTSTVTGGVNNSASGDDAFVGGGSTNSAQGAFSAVMGRQARALHDGTFVWADGGGVSADFPSTGQNQFLIRAHGGVGIGLNNPQAQLDVHNKIRVSDDAGNAVVELGVGLDYAEGFDIANANMIQPGTVLAIDPDNPGKLAASSHAYDSKVAGIVAGAKGLGSGIQLGSGHFAHNVALAGRVYCNVDASTTGIEPGDLLTTSGIPGYAMKATDYKHAQGAILGKAMERLEKGNKGQILVLVTLQ